MNNNYPFFLSIEEYLEAINNAHEEYLRSRFSYSITSPNKTYHVEDLAVNSASFFESALILLDHFSTVIHNKVRNQQTQDEYEQYIKDKKNRYPEPETKVASVTDDPLWHEALNSDNKKKKKKFRK
jgi:hypothetical protein